MTHASANSQKRSKPMARSVARLAVVQALYQMEITGAPWDQIRQEFETYRIGAEVDGIQYAEADITLFRDILAGTVAHQIEIDRKTDTALVDKWPLGRVDATLRAIFRGGVYELCHRMDVPPKVIISEYVNVTRAFFDQGRESKFVNAVLDQIAHEGRSDDL